MENAANGSRSAAFPCVNWGPRTAPNYGCLAASRALTWVAANPPAPPGRKEFIRTLLDRDLAQWGVRVAAVALQRFWAMLAHYHGQTWNVADPARAGRKRVDLPQVPRPADRRLRDPSAPALAREPQEGPGQVAQGSRARQRSVASAPRARHEERSPQPPQARRLMGRLRHRADTASERHDDAYFWGTHQGAEIDLILRRGDRLFGVECKRGDAARKTPSIRIAMENLATSATRSPIESKPSRSTPSPSRSDSLQTTPRESVVGLHLVSCLL